MLVNPAREVIQLGKENPAKNTNCQHKPMWSWVAWLAWEQTAGGEKVGVVKVCSPADKVIMEPQPKN